MESVLNDLTRASRSLKKVIAHCYSVPIFERNFQRVDRVTAIFYSQIKD